MPKMQPPIKNFIELIPGFLQSRAQANAGITLLGAEFIHNYQFTGKAQVELDEWDSNWKIQAEWIYRLSLGNCAPPVVMVAAYSWGAGFGFTHFASELRDHGIEIAHAVLCDPVFHLGPRWMHNIGVSQLRAYYPFSKCTRWLVDHHMLPRRPKIYVPDNVRAVTYFIQKNSALCGHEVKCHSKATQVERHEIRYRTHTNMDDAPEFFMKCREVAASLFDKQDRG